MTFFVYINFANSYLVRFFGGWFFFCFVF
jgi:hypothetical protein